MSEHYNKLSPAEAERLAMLAEEAGEIVQIVGKILRHGYESFHPADPATSNRDLLMKELRDFVVVYTLMAQGGDICLATIDEFPKAILQKLRYAHHQSSENSEAGKAGGV
ncbi:hypothetical protein [Martelella mediterranea]|uniref:MazG-like nucleotide pyrophosphohydrolase family protein n=1 Tax=Martelella mediterranea TaxID=293089 RepID=A0A4V2V457_9HYPH|nr:hypothetical protein [Martelella mediterranea]TCT37448.1 hypothetical protein EDC90_101825 [Martelella mediterranea]